MAPEVEPALKKYTRLVLVSTTIEGGNVVLMQKLGSGYLMFPGGRIEDDLNEDPLDALRRELMEETQSGFWGSKNRMMDCLWSAHNIVLTNNLLSIQENYFILPWDPESSLSFNPNPEDPEILEVSWYSILEVLTDSEFKLYPNTRDFLLHLSQPDILSQVYQYELGLTWY